jgi:two-component system chemotaxis response regulator CheB
VNGRNIVVVGASAGGVEALVGLVSKLPPDLPAVVLVVLHVPGRAPSALPRILRRAGGLVARHAHHEERMEKGRVYVAPPDRHMLVQDGRLHLSTGPRENGNRPAIDPLFRTAARAYGRRVVGVVLSGVLDDGTSGLAAVKEHGGLTVAQDPAEARYPDMPTHAAAAIAIDHVLTVPEIGELLARVATEALPERPQPPRPRVRTASAESVE